MADARTEPLDASDDPQQIEYRSTEPWSIAALLLGLASPVAFIAPVLWLVPILGALAALRALAKLRQLPERTGHPVALVGLAVALFCLTAPIVRAATTQWLLAPQARVVSNQFIQYLVEGSPEKALVLHLSPDYRPPIDAGLWTFLRNDPDAQHALREMVRVPAIRMLLELGKKADVRFYRSRAVVVGKSATLVDELYTVTFTDQAGKKKTILLGILMERKPVYNADLNPWRVRDFVAGSES